ncbi:hypothetical protein PI86_03045 [Burkholderia sp. A9]|nr:hypothetical protein PI86_03045 [Burkholderia sp. A9]
MDANRRRSASSVRSPSPKRVSRRDFIGWTGTLAGGAVLGGPLAATRALAAGTPPNAAVDLIWGDHGAAARIAASLAHLSRFAFRKHDFDVTHTARAPARSSRRGQSRSTTTTRRRRPPCSRSPA